MFATYKNIKMEETIDYKAITKEVVFLLEQRNVPKTFFQKHLDISAPTLVTRIEKNNWRPLEIEKLKRLNIIK